MMLLQRDKIQCLFTASKVAVNVFFFGKFGVVLRNKKSPSFPKGLVFLGGRSVSNRRPPEPQSGALTN